MSTLKDMPMIGRRKEGGYLIFQITGTLDSNIYPHEEGEGSLTTDLRRYLQEAGDTPIVLEVAGCRFCGSTSLGIFVETYRELKRKFPVIGSDEHLIKLLTRTRILEFLDLYKTADELPSTSSR